MDKGTEFASKAMNLRAYTNSVHLDFIRPRRPVENGYIVAGCSIGMKKYCHMFIPAME